MPPESYGTLRERAASVSFADIESAARKLMTEGEYPSVHAVREQLKRGSTTTISDAMRRFWKDQAALNAGNPVALTRLPPEFADAAVELWERALRLSLQTVKSDDNGARAKLEELKRDTEVRTRSLELREKEWDMAARVRERALSDAREQTGTLLKELAVTAAELRTTRNLVLKLEAEIEDYRRHLTTLVTRAVSRSRKLSVQRSAPSKQKRKTRTKAARSPPKHKLRRRKKR